MTDPDPYLPLKQLAGYSGLSVRTLRSYLAAPSHPLPCFRIGGKSSSSAPSTTGG
jgi:hypothetical protein